MKKTAVLAFPQYCNYEWSVALSALAQFEKPVVFFGANKDVMRSEEGLPLRCDALLEDLEDVDAFDSLLITGCMDPLTSYMQDMRHFDFVRRFDRPDIVIGAISSGPILLGKSGVLRQRAYTCGVPREIFEEVGLDPAQYQDESGIVEDENLITAKGWEFVEFGIRFGKKIGLEVDARWYGVK